MTQRVSVIIVLLVAVLAAGCGYQGRRVDADVEAVLTQDFNPKDLQIIAKDASAKLLAKNVFPEGKKPFLYVAKVRNLTDEHINSEAISEYIAYQFSESGKVRLTEVATGLDEAIKQLEFQQGAFVDPDVDPEAGVLDAVGRVVLDARHDVTLHAPHQGCAQLADVVGVLPVGFLGTPPGGVPQQVDAHASEEVRPL